MLFLFHQVSLLRNRLHEPPAFFLDQSTPTPILPEKGVFPFFFSRIIFHNLASFLFLSEDCYVAQHVVVFFFFPSQLLYSSSSLRIGCLTTFSGLPVLNPFLFLLFTACSSIALNLGFGRGPFCFVDGLPFPFCGSLVKDSRAALRGYYPSPFFPSIERTFCEAVPGVSLTLR